MARVAGASEQAVARLVVWPGAVPHVFAGLKISLSYAIGAAVVGELISSNRGLGYLIQRPESHAIHHARGVHAHNYADLPLWDIVFGTFRNAPAEAPRPAQGFYDGASARVWEMLTFRDVSNPAR